MMREQEGKGSALSLSEAAELLLPPGNLLEEEMGLLELPYAQLLERAWEEIKAGDLETKERWARIFLGYWYGQVIRYAAVSRDSESSITDDGAIDLGEGETFKVNLTYLPDITQGPH